MIERVFEHTQVPGEFWRLRPDGTVVHAIDSVEVVPVAITREATNDTEATVLARVAAGELVEVTVGLAANASREPFTSEQCEATCRRGLVEAHCELAPEHKQPHAGGGLRWAREYMRPRKPKSTRPPSYWSRRTHDCEPSIPVPEDPFARVTTQEAAALAGVQPGTIRQWKARGWLHQAVDGNGDVECTDKGHPLFALVDVVKAKAATDFRSRRNRNNVTLATLKAACLH